MAEVESTKCPNCGAAVTGTGIVLCPYCATQLRVGGEPAEVFPFAPDVTRFDGEVRFDALPDTPITPTTKEIPFNPEIVYANLPGGKLDRTLKKDAEAILALVETGQRGINAEDLDLYLSTVSRDEPAFYDMVKRGATTQFINSDLKRYTTKVDFLSLTPDTAEVLVSFEAFVFPSRTSDRPNVIIVNVTQHMDVTFNWSLRKTAGLWKIVGTGMTRQKVRTPVWLKVMFISIAVVTIIGLLLGLLGTFVGIGAALLGVVVSVLATLFGSAGT